MMHVVALSILAVLGRVALAAQAIPHIPTHFYITWSVCGLSVCHIRTCHMFKRFRRDSAFCQFTLINLLKHCKADDKPGVWKFCRRISTGSVELAPQAASSPPGTFMRFAGSGSFVLCPTFRLPERRKQT